MLVAIDRTSKFVFVELHERVSRETAADFLRRLIEALPVQGPQCAHRQRRPLHDAGQRLAYNFGKRLKALAGLTPFEATAQPGRMEPTASGYRQTTSPRD